METKNVKFVVFVPLSHADIVRKHSVKQEREKIGIMTFVLLLVSGSFRGNEKSNHCW